HALILLAAPDPQAVRFTGLRFQKAMQAQHQRHWELTASPAAPPGQIGLALRLRPDLGLPAEGYRLAITAGGLSVEAVDPAGLFHGVSTLLQIGAQSGADWPCLHIEDWPDFAVRGVMLDISRDRVPTLETVLALVDQLAGWKINQFQLYMEHTFAYRAHPEVWEAASPFTGEEILALDAFCRDRHIELVPNQNSLGHMHRWLKHPRYRPLAETLAEFDTPWGIKMQGPFGLCPVDPGSLALVRGLYDELLPHFTSRQVNVGLDEAVDLGQGRSQEAVAARGAGRVYLDYLQQVYADVTARGRVMQFWGDIIIGHPDLIPELPRDAIALEWGYEADHPFDAHGAQFRAAGLPFYVCPGTASWNSIAGRTANTLGNLRNAVENGLKHGARGYLITDWGDNGHWQSRPVSDLGFAAGAAYCWAWEANRALDVARALSLHAFDDPTGNLGQAAYDLGTVYQLAGFVPHNSSALFWALQLPLEQLPAYRDRIAPEALTNTVHALDAAGALLAAERSRRPDAGLVRGEFELAARLLRHAVGRLRLAFEAGGPARAELGRDLRGALEDYRSLWLARCRPGGLADSAGRLAKLLAEYAD
ncbi:MAG: family 20 glycosylhydrolase, partial [Anaerolineales bacterium]|nr:family 20 glycosylhydrolase [Anaerolineales bacterium]